MNETMNIFNTRYSLRSFSDKKIDPKILKEILQAGMHAATAGNLQPLSIIKIEDPENSKWFVDNEMQELIAKAPLNLLFCLDFHRLKRWSEYHHAPFVGDKSFRHFWVGFQDVIIAAQSIETAARSYGIGSVYIGTVVDKISEVKEKFNLPVGVIPVVLLTMGYPKNDREPAKKLSQDIVVHDEYYHDPSMEDLEKAFVEKYGEATVELTAEKKKVVFDMIEKIDGKQALKEAILYFEHKKVIDRPIRYFCFHYNADVMASDNTELLKILENDGFIWAGLKNHPVSK